MMSTLPPNLPDARTAQRLLDIFAQLEQTLRMGQQHSRQSGNAADAEFNNRLANLQFENQRLKNSRTQAAQRLSLLMERLQQQLDAETEATTQNNPESLAQDHAA